MTKENLTSENLIEIHENLNEFAKYHHNKGGQEAHKTIKKVLIDNLKDNPRDGSPEGRLRDEINRLLYRLNELNEKAESNLRHLREIV